MEIVIGKAVKYVAFLAVLLAISCHDLAARPSPAVKRIEHPLAPSAISRIGGFVGTRLKANVEGYLKVFDIDHYVRLIEQKQYRDWKWIGEQSGKWLESTALAAEQTGDDALRQKAEIILARLIAAQEPGGYLGVTDPAVRTAVLPLRGMDAYELYFMMHGLLTTYDLWGEDSALQAAWGLGDYFVDKIGPGKAEFWPRPKGQTIAGHSIHYSLEGTLLADPMLRLYQETGDRKYLKWSQWVIENIDRWSGHNTFSKLDKVADGMMGVHELQPRVHAHTLHMNLLGFLRLYQITGDETLLKKVRGAWRDIAGRQMYLTGGVSVGEYYRPGHNLPLTGEVVETCAMMSWIELSQYLLELTADTVYADAIEKLLWNHLFAAQTVDGDIFRYHTPLNGTKPKGHFRKPDCCTASGPRITAKIPSLIYAAGEEAVYVNQFIKSRAEIKLESGNIVTITQETNYPSDGTIVISIELQKQEQFCLNVRLPAWCRRPSLKVNEEQIHGVGSGTYAKLNRFWKKGDRITLSLPMQAQWIKRSHTTEDLWALKRGPVVYAVDTVWWDKDMAEQLGSVPEDLSKVIKVAIDKPGQTADLLPAGVLGPAYPVTVILPNDTRAKVKALPFANVGRWYSEAANKPNRNERQYSYAVWLPDVKNIPAFPDAEGAGAGTPGGRGGKVIEVINLNDRGPGSLREAVEADGPRIVVFRISGIIKLDTVLTISNPFITIAGQTAPGDGICISGQTTEINTHDVIIRYLRFRRGNIKDRNDALGGYPIGNVIVDHCSASWGLDENLSLYRYMKKMPDGSLKKTPAENITIQWCISSEALDLNNHAFGGTWGGRNCSFHHNLFACNTGRNPSIGWGDHFDFRNNVLFNWRHRTVDGGDASSMVNVVANYYKPGPAVNEGASRYRICRPQHLDMHSEAQRDGKWYVADNFVAGNPRITTDNWAGGVQFDDVNSDEQVKALIEKVRTNAPIPSVPITQQSAEEAYELVLAHAGATLPRRDTVDVRITESVRTGRPAFSNGIIDTPADVGGWPDYKSVPAPIDTDHDGMPDEWEEEFGLNPNDPSDASSDKDGDDYTNVEEWLNGTKPTQYVDYSNDPSMVNFVPIELRCENIQNPLGIDTTKPHLFWKLKSAKRDQTQTAFQILVSSTTENLDKNKGDLWDSGKVLSDETIQIRYEGRPLKSSQQVFWKVRAWDKDDKVSPWSKPASWTSGLFDRADWQAKWIIANRTDKDPLPIFRKSFRLDKPVRRAIIHICGLGHYELRLNGRRVSDYQMDPGWTNYRKTCLYRTYDVTNMLDDGDNAIGVMLGNGMYNVPGGRYTKFKGTFGPPKLICQMYVTFADGSTKIIVSDETWKYAVGPILFTCIYGGEDYDARREQAGWDKAGFDDGHWLQAKNCDSPGGKLSAQYAPPIKVADYLPAVEIRRLEKGKYEIDCSTNLSARPVIKVKGPSGSKVVITCAEKSGQPWLQDGGHVYNYTLKGEGEEVFRPSFTYFSFQYLYISGVDRPNDAGGNGQRPLLLDAGSEFLTSSAPLVGKFQCSNKLFNDIDAMIERSVRSNLQSVVTDCPHREKLGWLEVPHLMGPSIFYHRDVYNLYRKICRDTSESQLESGLVPDIAPEYTRFSGGFFESPEWGSACVQVPELLYKWYGDDAIERRQYETMKRYTLYLASTRNKQGLAKAGLGDWYDWTPENGHRGASQLTPGELTATAFLYDNAKILNRAADRLGKKADADDFEKLAQQVQRDFIKAYYKPATHSVATGSQASIATALYFGLVPEEGRRDVLANLVAKLEEANYRQSTGEVCFRMLVQSLADVGRSDVVYRMINRTDAPGYGHILKLGFKTLSERWDKPGSSMNHCMFGHIQEWFGNSILGIRQALDSVGFKRLLLRPEPVGDLTSASGYYDSVRGRIESRWQIENGSFHWHFTVPPNTTAEAHVPTSDVEKVTESGRPIDQSVDIVFLRIESAGGVKRAVFKVSSGEYEFQSQLK